MAKSRKSCYSLNSNYFATCLEAQEELSNYNNWIIVSYKDRDGNNRKFTAHVSNIEKLSAYEKRKFARKMTENNNMTPFYSNNLKYMYVTYEIPTDSEVPFVFYT